VSHIVRLIDRVLIFDLILIGAFSPLSVNNQPQVVFFSHGLLRGHIAGFCPGSFLIMCVAHQRTGFLEKFTLLEMKVF
jgi:hypothetical protein